MLHIHIYDISSVRVNDLTLILLTWRKCWAPNNTSKQQMGFNSAFKGLNTDFFDETQFIQNGLTSCHNAHIWYSNILHLSTCLSFSVNMLCCLISSHLIWFAFYYKMNYHSPIRLSRSHEACSHKIIVLHHVSWSYREFRLVGLKMCISALTNLPDLALPDIFTCTAGVSREIKSMEWIHTLYHEWQRSHIGRIVKAHRK